MLLKHLDLLEIYLYSAYAHGSGFCFEKKRMNNNFWQNCGMSICAHASTYFSKGFITLDHNGYFLPAFKPPAFKPPAFKSLFLICHGNFGPGNLGPPDQNFR